MPAQQPHLHHPLTCRARLGVASRPRSTSLASLTRCGRPLRGLVIIGLLARMGMSPGPMLSACLTPESAWQLGSVSRERFPNDPSMLCRASTAGAARPHTCTVRRTQPPRAAANAPLGTLQIIDTQFPPVHTLRGSRVRPACQPSPFLLHLFSGPTIRVKQGMRVTVNFKNNIPLPTKNSSREPARVGINGFRELQEAARSCLTPPETNAMQRSQRDTSPAAVRHSGRSGMQTSATDVTPATPCNHACYAPCRRGLVRRTDQHLGVAEALQRLRPPALCP